MLIKTHYSLYSHLYLEANFVHTEDKFKICWGCKRHTPQRQQAGTHLSAVWLNEYACKMENNFFFFFKSGPELFSKSPSPSRHTSQTPKSSPKWPQDIFPFLLWLAMLPLIRLPCPWWSYHKFSICLKRCFFPSACHPKTLGLPVKKAQSLERWLHRRILCAAACDINTHFCPAASFYLQKKKKKTSQLLSEEPDEASYESWRPWR